jgi:MYXO-CTERM domain-containing protein
MLVSVLALATLSGLVVEDANSDGVAQPTERALADVVVSLDGKTFAKTDAQGHYTLEASAPGVVWVRIPDGFTPVVTWKATDGKADATLDFALTPRPLVGPLRFVQASDSHIGQVGQDGLEAALAQATSGEPAVHFMGITGDLTQGALGPQFEQYADGASTALVPVVHISGNHDFYDQGKQWRARFGPLAWSFDAGGVHFVVISAGGDANQRAAFIKADATMTPPGTPVAAFIHFPLSIPYDQTLLDALLAVGTKWLFDGHYHANRTLTYGPLVEYNVEPLVFGGMDGVPAGYQVVTIDDGVVSVEHHSVADVPIFEVAHPRADSCVPAGPLDVVVAIEQGPGKATVEVVLDGQAPVAAAQASAWDWRAHVDAAAGAHTLVVRHARQGQPVAERQLSFCGDPALAVPAAALPDWPQLGGSSAHAGATAHELGFPLAGAWMTPVGGNVQASPVLAGERLFVPVIDFGSGGQGGLVAVDARTGAILWERRDGSAVHGPPAVEGDRVVYATLDGTVHALDVATGEPAWTYVIDPDNNAGKRDLHDGVTIADGTVYAGAMYRFAAIDLASGALRWEKLPTNAPFPTLTHATPVVVDDLVIASVGRVNGTFAWEGVDGAEAWKVGSPLADGVMSSPIVGDGKLVLGSGNSTLSAFRIEDGATLWSRKLYAEGHDYAFWLRPTPAVANGRLFVPTHRGELLGVALSDGHTEWSLPVGTGLVHGVHYEATSRGINAAPVVTGDVVWVGGDDGVVRAASVESGEQLWAAALGTPVSGLVPAGDVLYVSGWDGSVRALVHATKGGLPTAPPAPPPGPPVTPGGETDDGGCGCRVGGAPAGGFGGLVGGVIVVVAIARRRRKRR